MVESKSKWTGGGIRDLVLDCPMETAWDLFSDWINWGQWFSQPDVVELLEGENRKPGCLRLVQYPDIFLHERILQIDNEKHLLSYSIEGNNVLGGMKGYSGTIEFQETSEGKTSVLYWKFEVEPVENQTPEAFRSYLDSILRNILTELERGAQKVAAGLDPKPVKPTPKTTEDSVQILEKPAN